MKQVSSRLCQQCQTATATEDGLFCAICSTKTDVIANLLEDDSFNDDDKTVCVNVNGRRPSHLYFKAVQRSLEEPVTQTLPQQNVSSTPIRLQPSIRKRSQKRSRIPIVCSILLLLFLLVTDVTSYSSTTQAQRQAEQAKEQLDNQLFQAEEIGVPASFLGPLLLQEQHVDSAAGVLTVFYNQLVEKYYQRQAQQYRTLLAQVPGIIKAATAQLQTQAQGDVQNLQTTLARVGSLGVSNTRMFAQHLSQEQLSFAAAHRPADYVAISADAHASLAGLNEMARAFQLLTDLAQSIATMKQAHLDVTSIQAAYQNDLRLFTVATQPGDFRDLGEQITAQDQQIIVSSIQAFPYISATRLNEFEAQVEQVQKYGGNSKGYLIRFHADQVSAAHAHTISDALAFFHDIDADIASLQGPLVRGQAHSLLQQFHNEVETWGKAHLYYDRYDGHNYMFDNGYMSAGMGTLLDNDLGAAQTTSDFEAVVGEINNALFNLHMLEMDYKDQKAYDQVHASDLQLINHYALQKRQVLMISLVEQVMRVYQNGALVRSFVVTTGRQELPSIPGVWSVLARRSPVIFQSGEPKKSPYWFPDTPIKYALLYHLGGYFVHDAPWRWAFGPGTQFPHRDPIGTSAYNFDGSHGCINLQESDAAWVYTHTNWNTAIVIY